MSRIHIPYRGDLVSARLSFKQEKRRALRKFKRNFINLYEQYRKSKGVLLWSNDVYVHDDFRKLLGLEERFFDKTAGSGTTCTGFWVNLTPSIDKERVKNLSLENKKLFYKRAFRVFNNYGKRIEITYREKTRKELEDDEGNIIKDEYDNRYKIHSYKVFQENETKEFIETSLDGKDKLATPLYYRMCEHIIYNNISQLFDTKEIEISKTEIVENEKGNKKQKTIIEKYNVAKVDVTYEDIRQLIEDKLFKKRDYKAYSGIKKRVKSLRVNTFDEELYKHFIEQGFKAGLINKNLWKKGKYVVSDDGGSIEEEYWYLDWEAVKKLDEEAFLIFVQTNIGSTIDVKKHWTQRVGFKVLIIVVIIVISVLTWGAGTAALASATTIAGTIGAIGLIITAIGLMIVAMGMVTGNQLLLKVGQTLMLVGSVMSLGAMTWTSLFEEATQEIITQGVAQGTAQQVAQKVAEDTLLDQMLGVASQTIGQAYSYISPLIQAYSIYEQFQNIFNQKKAEAPNLNETPEESLKTIYMAENDYWDFINKQFPEYIIPATLKIL